MHVSTLTSLCMLSALTPLNGQTTQPQSLLNSPARVAEVSEYRVYDCAGLFLPLWKTAPKKVPLPTSPFFKGAWFSMCPLDAEPFFHVSCYEFRFDPSKATSKDEKRVIQDVVSKAGSVEEATRMYLEMTALQSFEVLIRPETTRIVEAFVGQDLAKGEMKPVIAEFGEKNVALVLLATPSKEAKAFISGSEAAGLFGGTITQGQSEYVALNYIFKSKEKIWIVQVPRQTGVYRTPRTDGKSNDEVKMLNMFHALKMATLGKRRLEQAKSHFEFGSKLL